MLTKRWIIAEPIPSKIEKNLGGFHPIMRQLLYNRGYTTQEDAVRYVRALTPEGTDAYDLLGIPQAVERIIWGVKNKEQIAIYGDYDVDGVTATALLSHALKFMGADVLGYIPNRFNEGYGLNIEALNKLHTGGTRLVITVDCGIRSLLEVDHAQRLGLELIITDHHQPSSELPAAQAIINPKQPLDRYPEKDLAGVGLAYKLIAAMNNPTALKMVKSHIGMSPPSETDYLDLVSLGTVADLVPLVGENRALVRAGLEYMRSPRRQGIMALIGVAGVNINNITASTIGYVLGPRLNAAGRLDTALTSLNLLLSEDIYEAGVLAQQLDNQNRERQKLTKDIQSSAEEIVMAEDPDALLLFAANPNFNPGVVGLAASRLTEQYYRPSIVATRGVEFTRGSCRSIPEFHITNALDQCSDLFERHGGHAAAAGFTVSNKHVPELKERMKAIAEEELSHLDLRPTINADIVVSLSEMKPELIEHLNLLQPTGQSNPPPHFVSYNVKVIRSRPVGKENSHLKLTLTDGTITFDAIAFRQGHWNAQMPGSIDVIYTFEVNEFNGRRTLQLNIKDLKPAV
ncbi:single-stranded-DNA-specific exonuclease RecJ [Chloroflexota bacterium]